MSPPVSAPASGPVSAAPPPQLVKPSISPSSGPSAAATFAAMSALLKSLDVPKECLASLAVESCRGFVFVVLPGKYALGTLHCQISLPRVLVNVPHDYCTTLLFCVELSRPVLCRDAQIFRGLMLQTPNLKLVQTVKVYQV